MATGKGSHPGKAGRPESEKLKPKPDVPFTPERKAIYLAWVLEEGTMYLGAREAGVTYQTIVNHRAKDPEFARQEQEAKEANTDFLIKVARGRAVNGVSKPLLGGQFKDEIVCYEQVFSDGLMQTLLKSRRGEFGSQGSEGGSGGGGSGGRVGGVLIVPAAPHSITEWTALYGEKAKGTTGMPE